MRAQSLMPGRRRRKLEATLSVVAIAAASLAIVAAPTPALAIPSEQPLALATQIGDREVRAVAQLGNRIYVGGNFRWVGPQFEGAVGFADTANGGFVGTFPAVNGLVNVALPDESGGWYVGGTFTQVGGVARQNVAHVDASGAVTAFDASATGPGISTVNVILPGPDETLFIGGSFNRVRGQVFSNLARVSATTGDPQAWSGSADGAVRSLALSADGSTLFVGGDFASIGGAAHARFASVSATTGTANALSLDANGVVHDLLLWPNGTLYVAGAFTQFGGRTRNRLGAVNTTTGGVLSWNPNANDTVFDLEAHPDLSWVWAAGQYTTMGGTGRRSIAQLNPTTGARGTFSVPQIRGPAGDQDPGTSTRGGIVRTVDVTPDGQNIYIGGDFGYQNQNNQTPIYKMAQIAVSTGATNFAWQPPVYSGANDLRINEIVVDGGRVLVAGTFAQYGGVERPYLVAIDATTGALDTAFNPQPNNWVQAIWPTADGRLFIGGRFTRLGAALRTRLAQIDPATGAVITSFGNPNVDSEVMEVVVHGDDLYVGGRFSNAGGSPRRRLARFVAATGQLDTTFDVPVEGGAVRGIDVTPDGSGVFIAGDFDRVGGQAHNDIARIDATHGQVDPWFTHIYDVAGLGRDLSLSPDGSVVYMATAGGDIFPGADSVAAYPTTPTDTDTDPIWIQRIGDTTETVVAAGDAVYIGGHFRYLNNETTGSMPTPTSVSTDAIGALDPGTGEPLPWNPGAGGFRGVLKLTIGPGGLAVGSDGWQMSGDPHARVGLFAMPDATPPTPPGKPSGTGDRSGSVELTWAASTDAVSSTLIYNVFRDGDPTPVGLVASASTASVGFTDTGLAGESTHTYTVTAVDEGSNESAPSLASDPIFVPAPDTAPPTTPGAPSGMSNSTSTVDLSWAGSVDDVTTTITYRVLRDGSLVGTTTNTSFTDVGLTPGSAHTYRIIAVDEAGNPSPPSPDSVPITVQSAIFHDDFGSGSFAAWTVHSGLSIDDARGGIAPPSARASVTGAPGYAYQQLGTTYASLCVSERVRLESIGGNSASLIRLRTAANGGIGRVFVTSGRVLQVRADVTGQSISSGVALTQGAWHTIELCGIIGASGTWELFLDGTRIVGPWGLDNGTTEIGRVLVGDSEAKTITVNMDDVIVDVSAG